MNELNSNYITEQNKLATSGAWIWLLEIETPTTAYAGNPLRYTNDNHAISAGVFGRVWPTAGGDTYTTMPFNMDDVEASLDGKFGEFKLYIGDLALSGDLRTRVSATAGLVGSIVRLRVVHSNHLDLTDPAIDESAEVLSCERMLNAVVLTLGIPSLLSRRFPRDRYVPGFCRHKFEGALCQYLTPRLPDGTLHIATSNNVVFTPNLGTVEGYPVNNIYMENANLVNKVFVFAQPPGTLQTLGRLALSKDTGFIISGSLYNDGFFLAENYYAVNATTVYVKTEDGGGRAFTAETVLTGVTLTLGYSNCDHTLDACKKRDNTQNYGGSPGISGGIYG